MASLSKRRGNEGEVLKGAWRANSKRVQPRKYDGAGSKNVDEYYKACHLKAFRNFLLSGH